MTWSYRVLRVDRSRQAPSYVLRELYITKDGALKWWSNPPVLPHGQTFEELAQDLEDMREALTLPVLRAVSNGTDGRPELVEIDEAPA